MFDFSFILAAGDAIRPLLDLIGDGHIIERATHYTRLLPFPVDTSNLALSQITEAFNSNLSTATEAVSISLSRAQEGLTISGAAARDGITISAAQSGEVIRVVSPAFK
ncbi:MAG: hypothetical protein U0531_09880 [Dehalococcoidia bacterium]